MPGFLARASMRQQSGRGDRLDPQDLASGSQQSGLGAPQNTPASGSPNDGSPNNGSPARPFQDADEETLAGFVVPYYYENSPDVRRCYVTIRFLTGVGDLTLRGAAAKGHQESIGGAWSRDMRVWVKFWGANVMEITRRREGEGEGTAR